MTALHSGKLLHLSEHDPHAKDRKQPWSCSVSTELYLRVMLRSFLPAPISRSMAALQFDPLLHAVVDNTLAVNVLQLCKIYTIYLLDSYENDELERKANGLFDQYKVPAAGAELAYSHIKQVKWFVRRALEKRVDQQIQLMQMAADRLAPAQLPEPKTVQKNLLQIQLQVHQAKQNVQLTKTTMRKDSTTVTTLKSIQDERREKVLKGMDRILLLAAGNAKVSDGLARISKEEKPTWQKRLWKQWATGTLENHVNRLVQHCTWCNDSSKATEETVSEPMFAFKVETIVEYFQYLERTNFGRSTPGVFLYTCKGFSQTLQMPEINWKDGNLRGFIKEYELARAKEVVKAPAMPRRFFKACEAALIAAYETGLHKESPAPIIIFGTFLFMITCSLRFDDAKHLLPNTLIKEEVHMNKNKHTCYRARCPKTKTDRIGLKPYVVTIDFHLEKKWMQYFFDVYFAWAQQDTDYFIMHWTTHSHAGGKSVVIDTCKQAEYGPALQALKVVLAQVCPDDAECQPFLENFSWHSARCTMIQWGRDHGAETSDLVTHMRSSILAMGETYTRDKTALSVRVLSLIQKGVQQDLKDEEDERKKMEQERLAQDEDGPRRSLRLNPSSSGSELKASLSAKEKLQAELRKLQPPKKYQTEIKKLDLARCPRCTHVVDPGQYTKHVF